MSVFCLLWVPFFYLFWRTFNNPGGSGSVWALLLGSIVAIINFFLGDLVSPGGFGFSRILYGFVDIVCLPVLLPLFICLLIVIFRSSSWEVDFANFSLLWLIPVGALRAISWSAERNPILLIAVPLLWTSLAVGIPFFINLMLRNFRWYTAAFCIIGILALPAIAAVSYWAFFSQQTLLGLALLLAAHIPFGISLVFDIKRY